MKLYLSIKVVSQKLFSSYDFILKDRKVKFEIGKIKICKLFLIFAENDQI